MARICSALIVCNPTITRYSGSLTAIMYVVTFACVKSLPVHARYAKWAIGFCAEVCQPVTSSTDRWSKRRKRKMILCPTPISLRLNISPERNFRISSSSWLANSLRNLRLLLWLPEISSLAKNPVYQAKKINDYWSFLLVLD